MLSSLYAVLSSLYVVVLSLKCRRFLSFFQRYIVRDISLTEMYHRLVTFGSARWLILKSKRHQRHGGQLRTVKRKIIAFREQHVPQPLRCTSF